MSNASPLIQINNLVIETRGRDGGKRLVDDVSLSVARGEVLGLIGESGAGKSTLGLAVLGYTRDGCRIAAGSVMFDGLNLITLSDRRRRQLRGKRIAYVAQSASASLNPRRALMDQCIETVVRDGGLDRRHAVAQAHDLFRRLRLPDPDHIGERYPHELSGGQLQRVMAAMAMLPRPDLVVFDEPTTALDVTTQVEMLLLIRDLIRQVGSAALYISHDLAVVMQLADRIMVLRDGRMVEEAPTAKLVSSPHTPYARALLNVQAFERQPRPSRSAETALLNARNIDASYSKAQVLHGVDVVVHKGETVAIVGESGSGKSTLARVLVGLKAPTAGSALWTGRPLAPTVRERHWTEVKHLQLVHQMPDTALNPKHSVRVVVERPLRWFGKYPAAECTRRARELLELVELDPAEFMERRTTTLSGGQKQRLCIARALAAEPELIICDEVTSAIDPLVADGILRLLDRLQSELGLAYLFITHDLGIVRSIADRVVVMQAGRVVETGETKRIFESPGASYTERLIRVTPQKRLNWLQDLLDASTCVGQTHGARAGSAEQELRYQPSAPPSSAPLRI
jgi:peptide/nickel transport system ATP-binding protein